MNTNTIRLMEKVTGGVFRRVDDDGKFVFEHDHEYLVGYTEAELEEAYTRWLRR